jgi:hypothetical protein
MVLRVSRIGRVHAGLARRNPCRALAAELDRLTDRKRPLEFREAAFLFLDADILELEPGGGIGPQPGLQREALGRADGGVAFGQSGRVVLRLPEQCRKRRRDHGLRRRLRRQPRKGQHEHQGMRHAHEPRSRALANVKHHDVILEKR